MGFQSFSSPLRIKSGYKFFVLTAGVYVEGKGIPQQLKAKMPLLPSSLYKNILVFHLFYI